MFLVLPILVPMLTGLYLIVRGNNRHINRTALMCSVGLTSLMVWYVILTKRDCPFTLFPIYRGVELCLKSDSLGSVFAGLISFLWPFSVLYTFEYLHEDSRLNGFLGFYVLTYSVTLGIAWAENLATMYFFYEMLTLVTFPLVLHYRDQRSRSASRVYLYYSLGGASLGFIGLVFVIVYGSTTSFTPGGVFTPLTIAYNAHLLLVVFSAAFFGFGVKAAVFPLHSWLPEASVAPTPVTALLHAVAVVKAGAFAVMRIVYFIYGPSLISGTSQQTLVQVFSLITIVYGSTMAVKESHIKRRLAYSTVANLSYILLGTVIGTKEGFEAALLHLVIHAIMKITNFFCAGIIIHKTHKYYVYEIDGLAYRMPVTFACFTVAAMSLTGVPLFAGFISKWYLATACIAQGGILGIGSAAVLIYSGIMTAIYMFTMLIRAYFPKKGCEGQSEEFTDPSFRMLLPIVFFSLLIIAIGIWPSPLVRIASAVAGGVV